LIFVSSPGVRRLVRFSTVWQCGVLAFGGVACVRAAAAAAPATLFIQEYRVEGARTLPAIEVEEAVYPFLGPGRTPVDVERARAALEKAYQAKGYQTVSVQVPEQAVKDGVVVLQVTEGVIGHVWVKNSRYYSQAEIRKQTPSLAEGAVPDFNAVSRELLALNQVSDRQITPSLRAGKVPGTVDIDLTVKDTLPLHGSLEVNNRRSANTTPLRVNGSVSYANLWQRGHTVGLSFQVAPEKPSESTLVSGYYLARVPSVSWLSLMAQASKQDSDVATGAGANSVGRGQTAGLRALIDLPAAKDFYQSFNFGFDYKHLEQRTVAGAAPITYLPFVANYNFNLIGKNTVTEFNAGVTLGARGVGSSVTATGARRYKADGGFIALRGDLSQTRELPEGFQLYLKGQAQVTGQALVDSEQFSGGGLGTARGYLESAALGDNAAFGTAELRTPSLGAFLGLKSVNELRFHVFTDAGVLTVNDPLPQQTGVFSLASFGGGVRGRFREHFNFSVDVGAPLLDQGTTGPGDVLTTFRVWADF
jgi:hemolysin activation/secretion protein